MTYLVSLFKDEYVDKNYKRLDAFFIEQISVLELEAQNCVCLALLLNLWTHKGNTWIYESLIQQTSSPSPEYSLLNTFFGHFYIDHLILVPKKPFELFLHTQLLYKTNHIMEQKQRISQA